jgi:hypothetical protein
VIVFLDFDGVLHPNEVYLSKDSLVELRGEGSLLMHVPVLERLLLPYPKARIILSTSWVRAVGFDNTIRHMQKLIPRSSLFNRIAGATWHTDMVKDGNDPFDDWTRFQQIHFHVRFNDVRNWLAIDDLYDGGESWPEAHRERLVLTDSRFGLGSAEVQDELRTKLAQMAA